MEEKKKERLFIRPQTDGRVSLQDANQAHIGSFTTASAAGLWARVHGYLVTDEVTKQERG